jgi:hypothetical protein
LPDIDDHPLRLLTLWCAALSGASQAAGRSAYGVPRSAVRHRLLVPAPTLASMKKWEYLTAPVLIHNTKMILDNFGADGWELVQILQGATPEQLVAYFKREKQ